MANKIFKGLKFPGMDDYYVLPEAVITKNEDGIIEIESCLTGTTEIENLDTTLTKNGYAADAAAVGTALAGKAPAGYGLNNNFQTTSNPSDVDGYQTTGWYRYVMNSSGVPLDSGLGVNFAVIRVDSYSSGSYVVQTMYTINYPGRSWQRYYYNGAWSSWVENTSGSKATTIYSGSLSSGSVDISSYSDCVAYIVSGATVGTYARVSVVIPKAALGTTYQLYSDSSYIVLKTSTSAITIGDKGATSGIVTSVVGIY